jgi:hypothetical protein
MLHTSAHSYIRVHFKFGVRIVGHGFLGSAGAGDMAGGTQNSGVTVRTVRPEAEPTRLANPPQI